MHDKSAFLTRLTTAYAGFIIRNPGRVLIAMLLPSLSRAKQKALRSSMKYNDSIAGMPARQDPIAADFQSVGIIAQVQASNRGPDSGCQADNAHPIGTPAFRLGGYSLGAGPHSHPRRQAVATR